MIGGGRLQSGIGSQPGAGGILPELFKRVKFTME